MPAAASSAGAAKAPAALTVDVSTEDQSSALEESAALRPRAIKINFQGAFIMEEDEGSPVLERSRQNSFEADMNNLDGDDIPAFLHDTSDIRLPNHSAVVSHVAVDVSFPAIDLI